MYDPHDFQMNPGKYVLFRTAVVARHVVTVNGMADLHAGDVVGIQYGQTGYHPLYRRLEPMYTVTRSDGTRGGYLYGSALKDFVL